MRTSDTYYLNAETFERATSIYLDNNLNNLAPDGFYSNGAISRLQSSGLLGPSNICQNCSVTPPPSQFGYIEISRTEYPNGSSNPTCSESTLEFELSGNADIPVSLDVFSSPEGGKSRLNVVGGANIFDTETGLTNQILVDSGIGTYSKKDFTIKLNGTVRFILTVEATSVGWTQSGWVLLSCRSGIGELVEVSATGGLTGINTEPIMLYNSAEKSYM